LREQLRALALRAPSPAPAAPLNRPLSPLRPKTESPARRDRPAGRADTPAPGKARPAASASTKKRLADARLGQLARYAKPDHESWFATALADAMDTSYALAERIMMDLSGRQLATTLIALGTPEATTRAALESFFPHLSAPSKRQTQASDLINDLDPNICSERLSAWRRADRYTSGEAVHVPALADGKPVRRDPSERRATREAIRTSMNRKTG
jgi:uncharacterized protein (DUF2336 family)